MTFGQAPAVHIVFPELLPGTPITWTGPGFAKVPPGTGLRFAVNNIPFPMDFSIAIRYEIQVPFNSSFSSVKKLNKIYS